MFSREAVPKITSSVEPFRAWSVTSTWLYLMPTFTNRFVSLTDFLFVPKPYKLLKSSQSLNGHVCSIRWPSCPASASGCAATRGSIGYCRAWTCRNCQRRPSWSPREPVSWWGYRRRTAAVTHAGLWLVPVTSHRLTTCLCTQVADECLAPDVLSTVKEMKAINFRRVPKMPVYGMAQPTSEVYTLLKYFLSWNAQRFLL